MWRWYLHIFAFFIFFQLFWNAKIMKYWQLIFVSVKYVRNKLNTVINQWNPRMWISFKHHSFWHCLFVNIEKQLQNFLVVLHSFYWFPATKHNPKKALQHYKLKVLKFKFKSSYLFSVSWFWFEQHGFF